MGRICTSKLAGSTRALEDIGKYMVCPTISVVFRSAGSSRHQQQVLYKDANVQAHNDSNAAISNTSPRTITWGRKNLFFRLVIHQIKAE